MLTQEMNVLAREIATAHDARVTAHTARRAAIVRFHKSSRTERDARIAAMSRLRKALLAELAKIRPGLAKSEAARSAGARTWLRTITADRVGAHGAWRDLTVTMHGKRVAAAASAKKQAAPPAEPAPAAKAE